MRWAEVDYGTFVICSPTYGGRRRRLVPAGAGLICTSKPFVAGACRISLAP